MTLDRISLALLAAFGLLALGCGDPKETGDTSEEADTDTDTDADTDVDYLDPVWVIPFAEFGLKNGAMETVTLQGTAYPPVFTLTLAEDEYTESWDDRYTCDLAYTMTATPGTSATGVISDLVLNLTADPSATTCDNLDPNVWPDPHGYFIDWGWEITLEEAGPDVLSFFEGYDEYANAVVGGLIYMDGLPMYESQTNYGVLMEVDDSMVATGELGDARAFAQGAPAWISYGSLYLWGLQ